MSGKKQEKVLTHFVVENKESIYRVAFSYVKNSDDALDIVQDSIQKALLKIESLEDLEAIKSWFYRIVVNTSLDFLRKQKRIILVDDDQMLEFHGGRSNDSYDHLDIENMLEKLAIQYREVIVLRFFEDLKIEEIANVLDMPVSTIKTRLYKALKILRIEMEKESINHE